MWTLATLDALKAYRRLIYAERCAGHFGVPCPPRGQPASDAALNHISRLIHERELSISDQTA